MQRRNFLKSAAILSTAGFITPVLASSSKSSVVEHGSSDGRRRFTLINTYHFIAPEGSEGVVKLWIPLPEDTQFQLVSQLNFTGSFKDAYISSNNSYGAKTLFATWPDAKANMTITVELDIETIDWEPVKSGALTHYRTPEQIHYPADVERYLLPTKHMPLNGIVKQTADKIVGSETEPLKQARLIYLWVSANMFRDNSVIGCGTGDVASILESGKLGGKCTDINSVFVALMRAVGIPAREMFGIRLGQAIKMGEYSKKAFGSADDKGVADVSGGQHCRAMFYLAGYGWLPADPADVTKMRLTEKKEHNDPAVQAVNDYLFGNWEMNWVGFNYGRDFDLFPTAEQTPLNNFGYPYAEVDGDPVNYYEPKVFAYDYQSTEQR
ncbi:MULTISPECIES: transglutaminase-like domain-containing protein [unclassified Shewanella]|uniref:transglutaminase-like domain-containing protein n=1 Tax=unclassified Shewanella TaxID=196818 RepID=UPI0021D88153|nr:MULTISPECIES: transglutaminase domain-containing protein [unclassified Shewanella]MCU8001642.1 transglutaminase domain-containing protein [Shewanella sp. SM96]MCU8060071.1 transglutaminase domain-containing protein [Shewanella sp. SM55]